MFKWTIIFVAFMSMEGFASELDTDAALGPEEIKYIGELHTSELIYADNAVQITRTARTPEIVTLQAKVPNLSTCVGNSKKSIKLNFKKARHLEGTSSMMRINFPGSLHPFSTDRKAFFDLGFSQWHIQP